MCNAQSDLAKTNLAITVAVFCGGDDTLEDGAYIMAQQASELEIC